MGAYRLRLLSLLGDGSAAALRSGGGAIATIPTTTAAAARPLAENELVNGCLHERGDELEAEEPAQVGVGAKV